MHLFGQPIWGDIWKVTRGKRHTSVTNATMHLFMQPIWGITWKLTLAKNHTNATYVILQYLLVNTNKQTNTNSALQVGWGWWWPVLPLETNKGKHKSTLSILSPALNSNLQPTFSSAQNFFTNCWKHLKTKNGQEIWQKFLCLQISKNIWKRHSDII